MAQIMLYMVTIIRATQEFEGATWVVYDDAYRHQAVAASLAVVGSEPLPLLRVFCGESQEGETVRQVPERRAQVRTLRG